MFPSDYLIFLQIILFLFITPGLPRVVIVSHTLNYGLKRSVWTAWADRITFEEIKEKSGKNETEVIKIMRKNLKPGSFRLWRKRVHNTSIKHRKKFKIERKKLREKIKKTDIY